MTARRRFASLVLVLLGFLPVPFTPDPCHAQSAPQGIIAAFRNLAGSAAPPLGAPLPDTAVPVRGPVPGRAYWGQAFTDAMVTYAPEAGLHVVRGPMHRAWQIRGGEPGLGLPVSSEESTTAGNRYQLFERGLLFWHAAANEIVAAFRRDARPALPPGSAPPSVAFPLDPRAGIAQRAAADSLGSARPESPQPNRTPGPRNDGFWQAFDHGWVYAREGDFAFVVQNPIFAPWAATGWEQGPLGFPTSDSRRLWSAIFAPGGVPPSATPESRRPNDRVQFFERGAAYLHGGANSVEMLTPNAGRNGVLARFTSVSPNAPYGTRSSGNDPGGRFFGIVADRSGNVYAAGETSGVWVSRDHARTWRQSASGLTTGRTIQGIPIALDGTGHRLLYAAIDNDDRRTARGGLFVSLNAGDTWQRATLPLGCSAWSLSVVAFTRSTPLALSGCGLLRSNDPALQTWTALSTPVPFGLIAAKPDSPAVAACSGNTIFMSSDEGASWPRQISVPGECQYLDLASSNSGAQAVVLYEQTAARPEDRRLEVAVVDFSVGTVANLGFGHRGTYAGGHRVFAAKRPDPGSYENFDIFATDGFNFFAYTGPVTAFPGRGRGWQRIDGVHVDTWGMAFGDYDPRAGRCTAYLVNDGGVYANAFSSERSGRCATHEGPWVLAQDGIHALNAWGSAGARLPVNTVTVDATGVVSPLPLALYLSTAHNGSWAYTLSPTASSSWNSVGRLPRGRAPGVFSGPQLANLGDSGGAYYDPALPGFVAFSRGSTYRSFSSDDRGVPPNSSSPSREFSLPTDTSVSPARETWVDPPGPPYQASLSQALTPPGLGSPDSSDFFAISTAGGPAETSVDRIMRNWNHSGWVSVGATAANLGCAPTGGGCRFVQIQAVRRRDDTVVYLLSITGKLHRVVVDSGSAVVDSARSGMAGPVVSGSRVLRNFAVNPYDFNEIYATDFSAGSIIATRDGGTVWNHLDQLTALATNGLEFNFLGCGDTVTPGLATSCARNLRPLQAMIVPRDALNVRVALLSPSNAIAFSNNGGRTWSKVTEGYGEGSLQFIRSAGDLLAPNVSGFFMPDYRGGGSLYVSYQGRSLMRIDAPFAWLR